MDKQVEELLNATNPLIPMVNQFRQMSESSESTKLAGLGRRFKSDNFARLVAIYKKDLGVLNDVRKDIEKISQNLPNMLHKNPVCL